MTEHLALGDEGLGVELVPGQLWGHPVDVLAGRLGFVLRLDAGALRASSSGLDLLGFGLLTTSGTTTDSAQCGRLGAGGHNRCPCQVPS